jgi:hypothetical protein
LAQAAEQKRRQEAAVLARKRAEEQTAKGGKKPGPTFLSDTIIPSFDKVHLQRILKCMSNCIGKSNEWWTFTQNVRSEELAALKVRYKGDNEYIQSLVDYYNSIKNVNLCPILPRNFPDHTEIAKMNVFVKSADTSSRMQERELKIMQRRNQDLINNFGRMQVKHGTVVITPMCIKGPFTKSLVCGAKSRSCMAFNLRWIYSGKRATSNQSNNVPPHEFSRHFVLQESEISNDQNSTRSEQVYNVSFSSRDIIIPVNNFGEQRLIATIFTSDDEHINAELESVLKWEDDNEELRQKLLIEGPLPEKQVVSSTSPSTDSSSAETNQADDEENSSSSKPVTTAMLAEQLAHSYYSDAEVRSNVKKDAFLKGVSLYTVVINLAEVRAEPDGKMKAQFICREDSQICMEMIVKCDPNEVQLRKELQTMKEWVDNALPK